MSKYFENSFLRISSVINARQIHDNPCSSKRSDTIIATTNQDTSQCQHNLRRLIVAGRAAQNSVTLHPVSPWSNRPNNALNGPQSPRQIPTSRPSCHASSTPDASLPPASACPVHTSNTDRSVDTVDCSVNARGYHNQSAHQGSARASPPTPTAGAGYHTSPLAVASEVASSRPRRQLSPGVASF